MPLQGVPFPDTREGVLPSTAPWQHCCDECLLHFRERDPNNSQWMGLFWLCMTTLLILLGNHFPPHQLSCSRTLSCLLTLYPASNCIFSQGKIAWACNVSNLYGGDGKFIIFYYFVDFTHQPFFPKFIPPHLTEYVYLHLKPSLCASQDIQVNVPHSFKALSCTNLPPGLGAHICAWPPFLGGMCCQFFNWALTGDKELVWF